MSLTGTKSTRQSIVMRGLCALIVFLFLLSTQSVALSAPSQDFLNQEERDWLATHKVLRLGVGVAFPPYQWTEKKGATWYFKGVVADYVNMLEEILGVSMKVVYGLNFNQALTLGKNKKIDLFPCLAKTSERSEFLSFTRPYISYPSVIITREDAPFIGGLKDLDERRISLVKDQYIYSQIKNRYGHLNFQIIETENAADDLKTVSFGKADACLMDLGVASYLIQKLHIANLKIAAPAELEKVELAMGVRDDWPLLQGIIQKTLDSIPSKQKDIINQRWINLKYKPGVAHDVILQWTAILGSVVLCVVGLLFFWNKSLQREILARKKIETERNALIDELNTSLQEVKTLQGFLPICTNCRKIREDSGYWQQIESYIQEHTDARFTHGICPDCMREMYPTIAECIIKKHDEQGKEGE